MKYLKLSLNKYYKNNKTFKRVSAVSHRLVDNNKFILLNICVRIVSITQNKI